MVPLVWNPLTVSFAPLHTVSSRRNACMIQIPTLDDDAARTLDYDQYFPILLSAFYQMALVAVSTALEFLTVFFAPLHTVSSHRSACMIQIPTFDDDAARTLNRGRCFLGLLSVFAPMIPDASVAFWNLLDVPFVPIFQLLCVKLLFLYYR